MKRKAAGKKAKAAPSKRNGAGLAPLIAEVRGLIQSARQAAATAVNTLQVMTNFEIGRRIVEHEQKGVKRAAYGTELLKELSARLTEEFGSGFSERNLDYMRKCEIFATGTTGKMLEDEVGLRVVRLRSGPLGGDQQIGALIAEGKIDILVFFWDPLEPLPHDPDIKALLRLAVVWNIPVACNRATADFLFSSPLLFGDYQRRIPDFTTYEKRKLE